MVTIKGANGEIYHGVIIRWINREEFIFDSPTLRRHWCKTIYWGIVEAPKYDRFTILTGDEKDPTPFLDRIIRTLTGWRQQCGD